MNKLKITGTSNLLPRNKAWDVLKKNWSLDFGIYGDWAQVLMNEEDYPAVWVMCLKDLIEIDSVVIENEATISKEIDIRLGPLVYRLENSEATTIVAFLTWAQESVIAGARSQSKRLRVARRIEASLYTLTDRFPSLYVISLDEEFAEKGMDSFLDARNYYLSSCRFSFRGLDCLAHAVGDILHRIAHAAHKVLVLDCDNTLWGGVVGEAGLDGIALGGDGVGRAYADFQRVARFWAKRGIILALLSKNNEQDVWDVFKKHPGMQLKKSDIATSRLNWCPKPNNLLELAEELGLGVDSFIFWDDSPFEREAMSEALPQVRTLKVPDDVNQWPAYLQSLSELATFSVSEEDRKKVEQYRQRAAYVAERKLVTDEESFLRSLEMIPVALPLATETLSRAEQLCMKTNQFNLRTIRYAKADLQKISHSPDYEAFLVQFKDRFGNHGIVGLSIAHVLQDVAFLDTFLLSCRVLGRRLECWMLDHLVERLKKRGCVRLLAEYVPTAKNAFVAAFLPEQGLSPVTEEVLSKAFCFRNALDNSGQCFTCEVASLNINNMELF